MTAQAPDSLFATPAKKEHPRKGKFGDRRKLATRFFVDLHAAWIEQGETVLARAAFHDPMGFARMVAALMPQKLEITHPTDGMTDERLADLLELAERMAALRANGSAHNLIDEKRLIDVTPQGRGGGPDRDGVAAGEGCLSTTRDAAAAEPENMHNELSEETPNRLEEQEHPDSSYATNQYEVSLREPVGKPFATPEHVEARANKAKLENDDIDPASLF